MAKDGLFVRAIARTHPRFGTPANAILLQGSIATILVVIGTFQQIIAYFIFVAVVFLTLAGAGLFRARGRSQGIVPVFLTPAYPVPTVVFLVLMSALLVLLALHSPREAVLGTAVVAAGLPVYTVFQRKTGSHNMVRTGF
jgi:basic amino acid/polyamine antiporter, APA family